MSMSDIDGVLVGGASLDPIVLRELQIINKKNPWPKGWGKKLQLWELLI